VEDGECCRSSGNTLAATMAAGITWDLCSMAGLCNGTVGPAGLNAVKYSYMVR